MEYSEQEARIKIGALICEPPYFTEVSDLQIKESECLTSQAGYKWISGKCYSFHATEKKYEEAVTICENKFKNGGKVVEPRTIEIKDLIHEAFGHPSVWVGIGYSQSTDSFIYKSDGTPVVIDAWVNFGASSHTKRSTLYCGTWHGSGWYNNYRCASSTLPFICESL